MKQILLISFCLFLLSSPLSAQSFDCDTAKLSAEKYICKSDALKDLDTALYAAYHEALAAASADEAEKIRQAQTRFISARNALPDFKSDYKFKDRDTETYLQRLYAHRLWVLSTDNASRMEKNICSFTETMIQNKTYRLLPSDRFLFRPGYRYHTESIVDINNDGAEEFLKTNMPDIKNHKLLFIADASFVEDAKAFVKVSEDPADLSKGFGPYLRRVFGYRYETYVSYGFFPFHGGNYLLYFRGDIAQVIEFNKNFDYRVVCGFSKRGEGFHYTLKTQNNYFQTDRRGFDD